jgi:hypothetical protein
MEYHKTRYILHIMQFLGHRNIKNTLVYTRLVDFENDDYHSAMANTVSRGKQTGRGQGSGTCAPATTRCSSENASKRLY